MGMTIDEALEHGKEQLEIFGGEHKEFIEIAIDIMKKYQQLQADYEARLKADKVAMLEELKKEIIELPFPQKRASYMQGYNYCQMNILDYVIQEKINALKAEQEE